MDGWTDGWVDGRKGGCMDGRKVKDNMDGWMEVQVHGQGHAIYLCLDTYIQRLLICRV